MYNWIACSGVIIFAIFAIAAKSGIAGAGDDLSAGDRSPGESFAFIFGGERLRAACLRAPLSALAVAAALLAMFRSFARDRDAHPEHESRR
ncbi:MAG TPA: hypothetical protein VFO53_15400, partial [Casimicrobiaceae bacterium]|nr:hypothetical protein [Casimicrobiaceae bacterium]